MLTFLSELLLPFSLGEDQVRVGLLQVGTKPRLEFGFDSHTSQSTLQEALRTTRPLKGDTNTVEALQMAKEHALRPGAPGGARTGLPRVLVWLTDGVKPGDVIGPMADLRDEGVAVLVVSTGHGNYLVLREVVSPPVEDNLYFVDIDDMSIITEDLRNAIIGECGVGHPAISEVSRFFYKRTNLLKLYNDINQLSAGANPSREYTLHRLPVANQIKYY